MAVTLSREFINAAELGAWEWDFEDRQLKPNDHLLRSLGYEPGEDAPHDKNHWLGLIHPLDLAKLEKRAVEALYPDHNPLWSFTYRIRHRDGEWLRHVDRARVVKRTADGAPKIIIGLSLRIEESEPLRRALREARVESRKAQRDRRLAQSNYSDLAAVSDSWLWDQDGDLRFTRHSRGEHADEFRISSRAMHGLTYGEWLEANPEIRDAVDWSPVLEAQAAHAPFSNFVFALPQPDGRPPLWGRISGAPLFNPSGEFCGYRGVGADITALREAITRAEEANRAKSMFLAHMSHEIRTPLNGVLGMTEVLAATALAPEQSRMVEVIRESGELLLSILNDILDMSKIEAGRLELEDVAFDPVEIALRVHDLHSVTADSKGLDFDIFVSSNAPRRWRGDPLRFQQILHNLTGNAVKFTSRGEVIISVGNHGNGGLAVEVSDTGIGMSADQLQTLGTAFTQGDSSTTRRFGGTGLGMAISRKILESMGGHLEVRSNLGQGTVMRAIFPAPAPTVDVQS